MSSSAQPRLLGSRWRHMSLQITWQRSVVWQLFWHETLRSVGGEARVRWSSAVATHSRSSAGLRKAVVRTNGTIHVWQESHAWKDWTPVATLSYRRWRLHGIGRKQYLIHRRAIRKCRRRIRCDHRRDRLQLTLRSMVGLLMMAA